MAEPLAERPADGSPIEVLEAGPGTGALTLEIVPHLRHGDHLTLCEINREFARHLERRFRHDPRLKPWRSQVTIHHGPVEELVSPQRFHHIVSGLPFNNFDPALVRQIFVSFEKMLKPGGTVNFFEYVGIRTLKAPFVDDAERTRLRMVEQVIDDVTSRRPRQRRLMLFNFPPAWVCSLQA
ncbi:MAG: methyltransferase domain-containing protein [Candidatus Sumerlaeaceae bacterium]